MPEKGTILGGLRQAFLQAFKSRRRLLAASYKPISKTSFSAGSLNPITTNRTPRGKAAPRKWAADRPSNGPHPYVMQAARQAEQQVPEPTLERDRAEHLEHLGERLALLAVPTDPNSGPSRSFARGILHEERAAFFGQHTERRVQALFTRHYRPSRALEEKRFPKLAKVNTKLVPKARGPKPDLRAELEPLIAAYDGPITACPPETTTAKLNKRPRGRPPDGDRAMTGAERKRRHRIKLRVIAETSPPPSGDANVRTVSKHQRRGRSWRAGSKRRCRRSGFSAAIHLTCIQTVWNQTHPCSLVFQNGERNRIHSGSSSQRPLGLSSRVAFWRASASPSAVRNSTR